MTNYYIEKDNKIIFVDTDLERLQSTVSIGEYSTLEIQETERPIENFEFADTSEYIAEQEAKAKSAIVLDYKDLFKELDITYSGKVSRGLATSQTYTSARTALQLELVTKLSEV